MIELKSAEQLKLIKAACGIVSAVIVRLRKVIKPGITTEYLSELARDLIIDFGGTPAFKGYRGFPADICTSVNEEVVHGIPSARKLKQGDIISLDIGVKLNGYFGDGAITVGVGKIGDEAKGLIEVTEKALYVGIDQARSGNRLSDISHAIQSWVEANNCSVVRKFVGHGIGSRMHEDPEIPNFGEPGFGPRLKPGMVLAIEPMVTLGTYEVEILHDGWTAVTKDKKLSAHFEHTVAITESGPKILTGT